MDFSISQPEISAAIYRTILAAYTESPVTGLPPAHPGRDVFITYVWPGKILAETEYQDPWSSNKQAGSMVVTENISKLVDPIPLLNTAYTQSGNRVEQLYEFILMASPSSDAPAVRYQTLSAVASDDLELAPVESAGPADDLSEAIADIAKTDLSRQDLERQYANASANLIANRSQYDLSDPLGKAQWERIAPELEAAVRSAWELVSETSPTLFLLQSWCCENPVEMTLSSANQIFSNTRMASAIHPTLTYHPSEVNPDNFADPETAAGWPYIPSIKVTTAGNTEPNLSISFRFCRVDINRTWFNMNLIKMKGWKIQYQPAGSLSSGDVEDNSGSFPLLPEFFVVARDLVISGIGKDAGTEFYSAKGLQILAWINRLTPFIPPE